MAVDNTVNVATKTVFKLFDVNDDGVISREDLEKYGARIRDGLKTLNPKEADNAYHAVLAISDAFGLTKNAKDGGLSYSMREDDIVRRVLARTELLPNLCRLYHSAVFKAIDTDKDGYIQRDEWSVYLKLQNTYTSEEEAQKSFDSLDKNKNGKLSLNEFVELSVDFWCYLGEQSGSQDLYGTDKL